MKIYALYNLYCYEYLYGFTSKERALLEQNRLNSTILESKKNFSDRVKHWLRLKEITQEKANLLSLSIRD